MNICIKIYNAASLFKSIFLSVCVAFVSIHLWILHAIHSRFIPHQQCNLLRRQQQWLSPQASDRQMIYLYNTFVRGGTRSTKCFSSLCDLQAGSHLSLSNKYKSISHCAVGPVFISQWQAFFSRTDFCVLLNGFLT